MELEKTNYMNTLFEFYHALLTDKQQGYLSLYYGDDFSLGEIAEEFEVSRQAVYDNIKRTEKILIGYEEKLRLVENYLHRKELFIQLKEYVQRSYPGDTTIQALIQQLESFDE